MQRLFSFTVPLLLAAGSIPTIPTLEPVAAPVAGIIADDAGVVFFVDSYSDVVWRAAPGRSPTVLADAHAGRFLERDPDGDVVVRTQPALSGDRAHAAARAIARFAGTGAMLQLDDGDVLFTTGPSVRRIGADGTVRTIAQSPLLRGRSGILARVFGESHDHLTGIAVDDDGVIYVANGVRRTVVGVSPDGRVYDVAASARGWTPAGVATSRAGLFVLEYGAQGVRVRRIDDSGRSEVVARVRPERAVALVPLGRFATSAI